MPKIINNNTNNCKLSTCPVPLDSSSDVIRFAAVGDYGDNANTQLVADLIDGFDPDFIVTLGDNNYSGSYGISDFDSEVGKYYGNYIGDYRGTQVKGSIKNKFFPVVGNHDWDSSDLSGYISYFTPIPGRPGNTSGNERYYNFSWGNIEFFLLSSDSNEPDGITSTSVQGKWLRNALSVSQAQYKIVVSHHNPYGSDVSHAEGENSDLRWPYGDWGADIHLSGHTHLYERLDVSGFPYIVAGTGGQSLRSGSDTDKTVFKYSSDYGAVIADITSETATFRFFNTSGTLIDQVKIFKTNDLNEKIPAHSTR